MDKLYRKIGELTADYIKLNNEFIEALNTDRPAEELTDIKEKIKTILEQIEALEKQRGGGPSLSQTDDGQQGEYQ
jgi:EAL domain-containing protein (putative c-di-GMP-specific phosphodiesterase class I)